MPDQFPYHRASHTEIVREFLLSVTRMMDKAQGLFEKGLYHRAATVLMDAFNRSKNEEQRMKILIERQRCLSMAPKVKAPSDAWCLAGRARNV